MKGPRAGYESHSYRNAVLSQHHKITYAIQPRGTRRTLSIVSWPERAAHAPQTPLYAFGYGLSYADFAYSNLKLSSARLQAGESLTVEVDVRNTAKIAGDEVVELDLGCPAGRVCFGPPATPSSPVLLRALRGFTRVHLAQGETRHVTFVLTARDLSQVTEQGEHIVLPGHFAVAVGGSSDGGSHAIAEFDIAGSQVLPR